MAAASARAPRATKAESLGETRMMGPDEPMDGRVVGLFTDPDGHRVGVVSG
jgi:hypothetical protein